jgi:hypothetical protein
MSFFVARRVGFMAGCGSYISPQLLASGDNNHCPLRGGVDSLPLAQLWQEKRTQNAAARRSTRRAIWGGAAARGTCR